MTAPVASVLIAAHNAAAFVREAVASALAQTLAEIEVIAVDDGSADGTWEALRDCARRDPRVVPLRQARQGGPAAARNAAIARARGRWLAVLDADDLFLPDRLERMVARAEEVGADLLADDLLKRDFATGAPLGRCFGEGAPSHPGPLALVDLVRGDMPDLTETNRAKFGFLQPIIRRDFLLEHGLRYAEDVRAGEDFLLYFDCVARGARLHLLPEALYVYRLRAGSVSGSRTAALHLSEANRRMLRSAAAASPAGRDPGLVALLRRRQRLLDFNSFALAVERGWPGTALRHLQVGDPDLLLRQLRVAAGAARRRLGAWVAGGTGRQGPGPQVALAAPAPPPPRAVERPRAMVEASGAQRPPPAQD
jgi:Glycosyl transferase family 2